MKRQLLDTLANSASFAVPEALVNFEFDAIWRRVEEDRSAGRIDDTDRDKDEQTLKTDYRAIAERRVRLGLLLSEVGRSNGITVGQDELVRAMRREASRYPGQEKEVMEMFNKNPQAAESLRGPIFEEKVVDFVIELAHVEEQPTTVAELSADPAVT
jgi:trigger factor